MKNKKPITLNNKKNNNSKPINNNTNNKNKKTNLNNNNNQNINKDNKTNIINNQIPKLNKIIKKPRVFEGKVELNPYHRNLKYQTVKKRFIKDNNLYTIIYFLDPKSFFNFIISCKKFYNLGNSCDDIWYNFYVKKFIIPPNKPINYDTNRGNWRQIFLNKSKEKHINNYNNLKNKFLTKYKKNIYSAKKDHYYFSNNLYKNLEAIYHLQIDKNIYGVKYIFTNKILSHINFLKHFDETYIDLYKITHIKLLFSEKNIGLFRIPLIDYNLKQIKLNNTENEGIKHNVFKVYYYDDLVLTTFEKNNIFFINISIPICKLCEKAFEFLHGLHSFKLDYACDCDSKFGLYDYSLLINLKSWNSIYFSLSVTTCDFKEDENNKNELVFKHESKISTDKKIKFDVKSLVVKEYIENFLICDFILLTYEGDHVFCESKPIFLKEDKSRIDYNELNCNYYYATKKNQKYSILFKFNINENKKYYCLIYTELRINKNYIEKIFKKY